jgi:hypothetical protein
MQILFHGVGVYFSSRGKNKGQIWRKIPIPNIFYKLGGFTQIHRKPMRAFVNLGEAFRGFDVTLFQKEKALC